MYIHNDDVYEFELCIQKEHMQQALS
jgi:hypothetical protein